MTEDQAESQRCGNRACVYAVDPRSRPGCPIVCCLPDPVRTIRPSRNPAHQYGPMIIKEYFFFLGKNNHKFKNYHPCMHHAYFPQNSTQYSTSTRHILSVTCNKFFVTPSLFSSPIPNLEPGLLLYEIPHK